MKKLRRNEHFTTQFKSWHLSSNLIISRVSQLWFRRSFFKRKLKRRSFYLNHRRPDTGAMHYDTKLTYPSTIGHFLLTWKLIFKGRFTTFSRVLIQRQKAKARAFQIEILEHIWFIEEKFFHKFWWSIILHSWYLLIYQWVAKFL